MPIQKLAPDVAAKIAAGEVIERPSSVVKELIENAIDAQAKMIRVEIDQGGKRLIKISDDGCGIPTDEVALAFERHATSKLSHIDDLFSVRTLGFRGEALASVAAVSQLSLITRPTAQTTGTQIRFEGGFQQDYGSIGTPVGTTITVENLFYNVPARLKFLKADATETGHIHRIVSHYALAYPEIRFGLVSRGRQVFQTDGNGDLYDVLVAVWGLNMAKEMVEVEGESEDGVSIYGYVSTPALHRGQRDHVVLFVNRRWIQDRSLAHAIAQAYHTFLPVGRHPLAVLNITMDPTNVDVNVHPTKAEVKFKEPGRIFSAVQRPVRAAVTDQAPMVRSMQGFSDEEAWTATPSVFPRNEGDGTPQSSHLANSRDWHTFGLGAQRTLPTHDLPNGGEINDQTTLPPLRVIGQIQQMYVITEGPDGLYLIDQHAAHERILYEKLMTERETASVAIQRLLTPILLQLTPAQAAVLEPEITTLASLGFEIEAFGGHSFRLLTAPEMVTTSDITQTFLDILDDMAQGAVPMARQTHDRVAIIVCKRISIKGGQTLSQPEMEALIRQLEASTNPRTCPHGRPTMLHLSANQLSREFGRH
ncbi:MAG: DNA mismatch repair endonuclease MutL [Chloroflexota bacterium]